MADETVRIVIQGEDGLSRPAGQASNALAGLQKAANASTGALGTLGSAVSSPVRALGGLVDALGRVGLAAMGIKALASSVAGLARGMVAGNAEFERYEVQFGVLLGSAAAAKKRLAELTEFAKVTPFELPEVVRADKILIAFGLDAATTAKRFGVSAEQIRTTIGDAASGAGVSFEMLAIAFGRFASGATGEAIQRFQELGIATREQMASWGMEFSKAGQLLTPAREAFTILEKHVRDKYGGMMEAQSRTFEGMLSNLSDWFGQTKRTLMAPLFDVLRGQLQGLLTFLSSPQMQASINNIAVAMAATVERSVAVISKLTDAWGEMSEEARRRVILVAGLFLAGGPFLKGVAVGIKGLEALAKGFTGLAAIAKTKVGLVGIAIGLVAGLAWQFADAIGAAISELGKGLRNLGVELAKLPGDPFFKIGLAAQSAGVSLMQMGSDLRETRQEVGGVDSALVKLGEESLPVFDALLGSVEKLGREGLEDLTKKLDDWAGVSAKTDWQMWKMSQGMQDGAMSAETLSTAGQDLGDALTTVKDKAAAAGISMGELVQALIAVHPATLAAAAAVAYWSQQIATANLALSANRDQAEAAQAAYQGMQDHLARLNEQLSIQRQRLADLASTPLTGMGAFSAQIAAIERQLNRLKLAELNLPSVEDIRKQYAGLQRTVTEGGTTFTVTGISTTEAEAKLADLRKTALGKIMAAFPEMTAEMRDYLGTLPLTNEGLQKILETLRLTQGLKFDKAMAKIKEAAEGIQKEMSYEDIIKQIGETKATIAGLTGEISIQEAAMQAQKAVIASINEAAKALNLTLAGYQLQLQTAQAQQALLNDALSIAYQWFLDDRTKMSEMGAEGVRVAGVMDEKTRALLVAISGAASNTTTTANATLAAMVAQYKLDMAKAVSEVGTLTGALNAIPTTITTVHTTVHRDVYEAAPEGSTATPEVPAYQHGGSFRVGGYGPPDSQLVSFMASPGERVTITPPSGAGRAGDNDVERLAVAIVRALRSQPGRPNVSQVINNYAGVADAGQSYLSLRASVGV